MTASEALERVAQSYVQGVAFHYGKLTPDPWFQAHEELEEAMRVGNESLTSVAAERFFNRCKELIERFKSDGVRVRRIGPWDGVNSASKSFPGDQYLNAQVSRKEKFCHKCESKDDLKLVSTFPGSTSVMIVCGECA